ncbi:hypothetical protein GS534_21360 [Rhodococcus hoagii]|nr:hypothetical protein [Prescottella equi]
MSSSVEQQTTAPEAPGRARAAAASLMPGVAVAAVATPSRWASGACFRPSARC